MVLRVQDLEVEAAVPEEEAAVPEEEAVQVLLEAQEEQVLLQQAGQVA